jgi:hypothetical protein
MKNKKNDDEKGYKFIDYNINKTDKLNITDLFKLDMPRNSDNLNNSTNKNIFSFADKFLHYFGDVIVIPLNNTQIDKMVNPYIIFRWIHLVFIRHCLKYLTIKYLKCLKNMYKLLTTK